MDMKKLHVFPFVDIRTIWKHTRTVDPILDAERFYLYASGRAALFYGISALPLTKGKKVLMPSYHCGVEVEAVIRAGFIVDFYPVKDNLEIDYCWLCQNISRDHVALVIVHYYGFSQPIGAVVKLCHDYNLLLIEDCAHALYSKHNNKWLGKHGDMAIFSLQKTVALPNGGGVLFNKSCCIKPMRGHKYANFSLLKSLIRSSLEFEIAKNTHLASISKAIVTAHQKRQSDDLEEVEAPITESGSIAYYNVPQFDYKNDIFFISKRLSKPEPFFKIINRRRRNYKVLNENIHFNECFSKINSNLPKGTCPLCFPVKVRSSDEWEQCLKEVGIIPFVFGRFSHSDLNPNKFANVDSLNGQILGLPVHQQLNSTDMEQLVSRINSLILVKQKSIH